MKCPNCSGRITSKNYDPEYEIYDCPKCGNSYTADEIDEAASGTSPGKRRVESLKPVAKAKKRLTEIQGDEEAIAKFEAESLKPRKAADVEKVKHRDEVPTGQVLEIFADEFEQISQEFGGTLNRMNAREFFAMNVWRDLTMKHNVHARDKTIPHVLCDDHSDA